MKRNLLNSGGFAGRITLSQPTTRRHTVSEHFFGLGPGHLSDRADEIAREHGAYLVNHTEPHGETRHWFACPNRGSPFDGATASAVMAALRDAGIIAEET